MATIGERVHRMHDGVPGMDDTAAVQQRLQQEYDVTQAQVHDLEQTIRIEREALQQSAADDSIQRVTARNVALVQKLALQRQASADRETILERERAQHATEKASHEAAMAGLMTRLARLESAAHKQSSGFDVTRFSKERDIITGVLDSMDTGSATTVRKSNSVSGMRTSTPKLNISEFDKAFAKGGHNQSLLDLGGSDDEELNSAPSTAVPKFTSPNLKLLKPLPTCPSQWSKWEQELLDVLEVNGLAWVIFPAMYSKNYLRQCNQDCIFVSRCEAALRMMLRHLCEPMPGLYSRITHGSAKCKPAGMLAAIRKHVTATATTNAPALMEMYTKLTIPSTGALATQIDNWRLSVLWIVEALASYGTPLDAASVLMVQRQLLRKERPELYTHDMLSIDTLDELFRVSRERAAVTDSDSGAVDVPTFLSESIMLVGDRSNATGSRRKTKRHPPGPHPKLRNRKGDKFVIKNPDGDDWECPFYCDGHESPQHHSNEQCWILHPELKPAGKQQKGKSAGTKNKEALNLVQEQLDKAKKDAAASKAALTHYKKGVADAKQ